jgi:hypothetical protein
MSKMNAVSQQQSTPAQPPALPADIAAELELFRQAALEGMRASFLGTLLRFKKGIWVYGEDKTELDRGTKVVALMNEFRRGYVRWWDGKATGHVVGKISEGFATPPRETLGDNDASLWPAGLSGGKEDPWVFTMYAPLKSIAGDDIYTFATSSDGGVQTVYKLTERYSWLGRKHPGEYPIVALESETYDHPRFGVVHKPKLEIVGWTGRPDVELIDAEPSRRSEMDDEIPF